MPDAYHRPGGTEVLPAIDQRPTHTTPDSPREELAALIAGWLEALDQSADEASLTYRQVADLLVGRFTTVFDDWEETPGGGQFGEEPGESCLHRRALVATLHRQYVVLRRVTERSVGE